MENKHADAKGTGIAISSKISFEMCKFLRGRSLVQAKRLVQEILDKKRALPMNRYNMDRGHKPGIGPGRYPINTCKEFLKLLRVLEANAEVKGMNVNDLVITHIKANRGEGKARYGRKGRVTGKSTHVEIRVEEKAKKEEVKK